MRTLTHRPRPWRALLAVLALVAVFLPAGGVAQAAPPAHMAPAGRAPATAGTAIGGTVTLVTGDKVTLGPARGGSPTVRFRPRHGGKPGTGDGFRVIRRKDGVYVVPDDVVGLVPGFLDAALFNVTALVAMGYDDAHRKDVPLIVKRANGVRTLAATGLRQRLSLDSIGASAATVAKTDAAAFGDQLAGLQNARRGGARTTASPLDAVRKVWLDARMSAADLDGYLTQVDAPAAWVSNLDGSGVPVAVLDSGVDDGHPDLAGKVTEAANFTDSPTTSDVDGHGTHVASILAGTGAEADGARRGVAYGANLLSGKVLGDDGFGQDSWVIAGMQWAVAHGAKVVNMSLGGRAGEADDPVAQALDELTASSGALFVVAAGNGGWVFDDPFTIESPGIAESALTVGAVDADDTIAWFSSEGPVRGSHRLKPDVSAPGMDILGARAGARDGDFYLPLSGTSQATPIVAGAAALLLQQHPDWGWRRVKAAIVDTADRSAQYSTEWKLGAGRVDLARATTETLTSSTANVDFGFLHYPATEPVSEQVTLTNDGSAATTVTLADEEMRYDGADAPADGVTVSPATLTVPAGGSATATVTVDPSVVPDGDYQGTLTVSAGDRPELRLPIGFYDEPEHYDLSVQVLDRNGDPYANGTIWLVDGDTGNGYFDYPLDADGRAKLRLVPGHWAVFSTVTTPGSDGGPATITLGGTSELDLDRDISYVLDARRAVRMRPPAVSGQSTRLTELNFAYGTRADNGVGTTDYPVITTDDVQSGRVFMMPSTRATGDTFHANIRWRLEPTGRVRPGTPDSYDLLYTRPVLGPELWPMLSERDVQRMARLDETFPAVSGPGTYGFGQAYDLDGIAFIYYRPVDAPGHRVSLLTAEPTSLWYQCLVFPGQPVAEMCDQPHAYRPGSRHATTWATGLHAAVTYAAHSADTMGIDTGMADFEHAGHADFARMRDVRLALYREGDLVGERNDTFGYFAIPDGAADFRLEQSYTLAPDALPMARDVRTTWTFHSAPPADPTQATASLPPILDLGYAPDVDSFGRARAGHALKVTVTARHLGNASPPVPDVSGARLSYSVDDGTSWHLLRLLRAGDGTWRTLVPGNALRHGTSVSVRAHATDAAGGTIDQTVLGMVPVA